MHRFGASLRWSGVEKMQNAGLTACPRDVVTVAATIRVFLICLLIEILDLYPRSGRFSPFFHV